MKARFFSLFAAGALLALSTGPSMAADDDLKLVWGGGNPEASAYSGIYVPHIIDVMANKARLSGYRWGGVSQGTVENAERVTKNPTNLGLGQLDILKRLEGKPLPDGSGTYQFTILQKDIGPECLYAITADKGYKTWGHVLGNSWDLQVVTGGEKSGSFGTWQVLADTFPELKDMPVVHAGGTDNIIEQVKETPGTFGFFIMRPDPSSKVFEAIDEAGLTLVPVVDFELEGKYEFKSLKIAYGGFISDPVFHQTACTSVALVTGDPKQVTDASTRVQRRLAATITRVGEQLSADQLTPKTDDTWRDMLDNAKNMTADVAVDLMEESKRVAEDLAKKANEKMKDLQGG